jgi:adenylyl cyclase-associated protein
MSDLEQLKEILSRLSVANLQSNSEEIIILQDILDKVKYGPLGSTDLPRSIRGYDEYITAKLEPFLAAGEKLGGDAQEASAVVKECWFEVRNYLLAAASCKEPSQPEAMKLFTPVAEKVHHLSTLTKRNEWENHLKTCTEGVGALNWLMVKPAPRDFIENFVGGSDFWANKIRKEYRTTKPEHCVFVDTFKALLIGLMDYVKEYHTTGVAWNNSKGKNLSEYLSGGGASSTTSAATTTTPAVATAPVVAAAPASAPPAVGLGSVFAELQPDGATAGLKKVTKEQQTWRAEFKGGDAPAPAPVKKAPAPAAPQVKGPAKLEYQDAAKKWVVENQTGYTAVEIKEVKDTVYIFGSAGATIDVKGKCKSIIIDSCKKVSVLFDNAIASCEVVNSQRINVTCRETVASVAIDKTDGIVVTLPLTSLETKIVASKSSEMNLSWPGADGELIERPIPEQYVHQINTERNGVTANVSDLYH